MYKPKKSNKYSGIQINSGVGKSKPVRPSSIGTGKQLWDAHARVRGLDSASNDYWNDKLRNG